MRRMMILSVIALALGGCAVGPNYVRPAVDTPPSWRMTDAEAKDVADTAWWGQFDDPVLDNLIHSALQENLDLQIASARVDEFAGRYGFVRADLFPQVGPTRRPAASGSRRDGEHQPPGTNFTLNSYSATLNAGWELDVWAASDAPRGRPPELVASEEGRRAVVLSLVGSVAGSYVNLRDLDRQLEIARERRSPVGNRWRSSNSGSRAGSPPRSSTSR